MRTIRAIVVAMSLVQVFGYGCEDETNADGGDSQNQNATGGVPTATGGMELADATGGMTATGGTSDSAKDAEDLVDIVDTAVAAGTFTQLADALTKAGLVDALKGDGPFTVFAPSDEAFDAFEAANPGVLASLDTDTLTAVLTYHVVADAAVMSTELKSGQLIETLAGPYLAVELSDGVRINEANVVVADIEASNGVIHQIDTIILPPGDIVEVAIAAGDFSTLAAALTDAGLVETLKGDGPFTVFAPTDDAFAALSAVPSGDALKDVLLYHVVDGVFGSGDLVDGPVTTKQGSDVVIDLSDGVMVNDAMVVTANIVARNGVIHVIDSVLLPQ